MKIIKVYMADKFTKIPTNDNCNMNDNELIMIPTSNIYKLTKCT